MSKKRNVLDEDNTFTRGVKRGNDSAMKFKAYFSDGNPRLVLRIFLGLLFLWFVVRLFF